MSSQPLDIATIALASIRRDGGTQPRAKLDDATVADYAERMAAGDVFPPVTVFNDGTNYWLADGFHRCAAAEQNGQAEIAADVKSGDHRKAVLHSVGVNSNHGLRRTNADKRRAVETLLSDAEWCEWSDSEIARRCAVSHKTVAKYRASILGNSKIDAPERKATRNGTEYTVNTAGIGSKSGSDRQLPAIERDQGADAAGPPAASDDGATVQLDSETPKDEVPLVRRVSERMEHATTEVRSLLANDALSDDLRWLVTYRHCGGRQAIEKMCSSLAGLVDRAERFRTKLMAMDHYGPTNVEV